MSINSLNDLIEKLGRQRSRRNQLAYNFFTTDDHIILDKYYDSLVELNKVPFNRISILTLIFGVYGLGKMVEDFFFQEFIYGAHHPFSLQLRSEFVRILGHQNFLRRHSMELERVQPYSNLNSILTSLKGIRHPHLLVNFRHYSSYEWIGNTYAINLKSLVSEKEQTSFLNEYSLVYTSYIEILLDLFVNNTFNYRREALVEIFFTLPQDAKHYEPRIEKLWIEAVKKAKRLQIN